MAYKQHNNPFSQQSYQKAQLKRFGHQKESKFEYDVRMRKEGRKTPSTKPTSKYKTQTQDPSTEISTGGPSYGYQMTEPNADDMRATGESFIPQEFKSEAGDEFRYRYTGPTDVTGKPSLTGEYKGFDFMDPDRPELGWIPAESVDGDWAGVNRIFDLYEKRRIQGKLFDSPVE